MSLSISRIVDVNISVSATAQPEAGFGLMNIVGSSNTLPIGVRYNTYSGIDEVAVDFATDSEEYIAAQVFFSQVPQPDALMISQRAATDLGAQIVGSANAETTLATWQAITTGEFDITVSGVEQNVTNVNFSASTDMEDIAADLTTATTGVTFVWDAVNTRFIATTTATGDTATISYISTPATQVGIDVSGLIACDSGSGAVLYDGVNEETLVEALQAIQDKTDSDATLTDDWYAFSFTKEIRDTDNILDVADWAEARTKLFANNSSDSNTRVSGNTTNISYKLNTGGYRRTFTTFDSDDDYASISAFARHATVDYTAADSSITLKFKQLPTITPENLTSSQADAIKSVNCNYYTYIADSRIFAEGKCADGTFIDETIGLDAFKNSLEVTAFNVLYQSQTKIPQTNAGVSLIVAALEEACTQFINNGFGAPGQVTIDNEDIFLEKGFRITAARIESQSQADREARKSPPIEIIFKGAGAIHFVTINAQFQR